LQEEGLAGRDLGELVLQDSRLAGEHQRREVAERPFGRSQRRSVLVHRQVPCRGPRPAVGSPVLSHVEFQVARGTRPYSAGGRGANVTSVIVSTPTTVSGPARTPASVSARRSRPPFAVAPPHGSRRVPPDSGPPACASLPASLAYSRASTSAGKVVGS